MHGIRKVVAWAAGSALALIGLSSSAHAQMSINNEWRYAVTPYAWLVGINGDVGVGRLSTDVNLSFNDVWNNLDGAAMGQAEAHKGPWMFSLDGVWAKVGHATTLAIRGDTGALDLTQHQTFITPSAGYTIGNLKWSVDFLGSLRYWDISTSLDVTRPRLTNERSDSQRWVDVLGGARFGWVPIDKLHFTLGGDGGGGGSRGTWQAYTDLNYAFTPRWAVGGGYRVIGVDYQKDNFTYNTRTKGFLVNLNYRTWP